MNANESAGLEITDIVVRFGGNTAVDGVSACRSRSDGSPG